MAHFPPTLNLCIIHFLSLLPTRQMIRKFGFDQTSATQGGLSSNAMSINIKDISVTLTRAFRIWKFEIGSWKLGLENTKLCWRWFQNEDFWLLKSSLGSTFYFKSIKIGPGIQNMECWFKTKDFDQKSMQHFIIIYRVPLKPFLGALKGPLKGP